MDRVETMAAVTLLGEQKRLMRILDENEQEEMNMGSALTELIMDGKAEGKASEISIIRRKLEQGLKIQEIAEWTGLDEDYIREMDRLTRQYPSDTDVEIAGRYLSTVEKAL